MTAPNWKNHVYLTCLIPLTLSSLLLFSPACSREPGETQKPSERLRVVAIFATSLEEPWDRAIHKALLLAKEKENIDYKFTDDVKPNQFEKTVRSFADERYDIIMGDAFAAEEIVRRVARDYPGIVFCFGSGLGPAKPNFSVFDNWIHEPAYLAGMIAGRLTKSNTIGVVAGFPVPEVNRIVNAFREGARETNPDVKLRVVFIRSWLDQPKAKEATHALIRNNADVIYAERDGGVSACAEKDIPVFGNMLDQYRQGPKVVVSSIVWDMWPTVSHLINSVRTGSYSPENLAQWSMMAKGGARLAPYHEWENKLPSDLKALVVRRTDEILTGRFRVPVIESTPESD